MSGKATQKLGVPVTTKTPNEQGWNSTQGAPDLSNHSYEGSMQRREEKQVAEARYI